ncbi:uncharacterized protein PHALS_05600 [Plasmopara halstedii]|uniref:Uncharacterized protein n=1 Tax=Plasmopara halstedii TaxID=4781 RepID=A0A0P1B0B7_PLAHL|nr:uncharacterized protein PHALS_05600 [Plasmopara halstedii]CEG48127.1 hypothetical protein PHALS_05600 [Plasmopara halstedii]|eukprot:XP_024584496.1 hypothetical protein PHALS_05600 [Plasmopara halstedii]
MTPSYCVYRGGLTWPAARGARLLRFLTSSQEKKDESEANISSEDFPYDLELCVPTAGHVALVLVQKAAETQIHSAMTRQSNNVARVVYVLDAIPPSRRGPRDETSQTRNLKTPGGQFLSHPVDEIELLRELFAPQKRATGGKEGSVVVKPPVLCARFDCQVISIQFIRGRSGLQPILTGQKDSSSCFRASSLAAATPLRCVVAREDGMAFLWEWQADLFQWIFLNRLCFLENPNLKWTKPVAAFTTTDLPLSIQTPGPSESTSGVGFSGATEFVWWSTATKHEPKLKLRRLRFERATDALRATDVIVGSAFTPQPSCSDIVKLFSSKLGLFAVSRTQGIFFRSSTASLQTVSLSWRMIFSLNEKAVIPAMSKMALCLHTITGELMIVLLETRDVYLVTSEYSDKLSNEASKGTSGPYCLLSARKLATLTYPQSRNDFGDQEDEVVEIAAHRHIFLLLTSQFIHIYTLVSGTLLESISLLNTDLGGVTFWTTSGASSSVGLWNSSGFWTIRVPQAKAIAAALHRSHLTNQNESHEQNPEAAFLAMKDYSTGELRLEAVRYALEVLERVTRSAMDPSRSLPKAWEAVWNTVSNPSFLLALLGNRATSENIVSELTQLVTAIYKTASGILSCGRLDGAGAPNHEGYLLRLTPANLESLHHLSNWIVLAKRKLARLESNSCTHESKPTSADRSRKWPIRAASDLTIVLANEDDLSASSEIRNLQRKDSVIDPEDAYNFRLSRKLRPMSSLRFAAGCSTSSQQQGRQWLTQLESFLLDGVAFKSRKNGGAHLKHKTNAMPSHRLFHNERTLTDFRHVTASSFSKHMYLESMSRLYLLYEPESLLPLIRCIDRFCPRIYSLSGHQPTVRSNAERAMTLFPPLVDLTTKALQNTDSTVGQAAKASLLAYVELLSYCGHYMEACKALLQCHLYKESKEKFLLLLKGPLNAQNVSADEQEDDAWLRASTSSSLYFLLLKYCMTHCDVTELKELLMLKPAHVDILLVLRALQVAFSSKENKESKKCATGITVGDLRSVLAALMQQRRVG